VIENADIALYGERRRKPAQRPDLRQQFRVIVLRLVDSLADRMRAHQLGRIRHQLAVAYSGVPVSQVSTASGGKISGIRCFAL